MMLGSRCIYDATKSYSTHRESFAVLIRMFPQWPNTLILLRGQASLLEKQFARRVLRGPNTVQANAFLCHAVGGWQCARATWHWLFGGDAGRQPAYRGWCDSSLAGGSVAQYSDLRPGPIDGCGALAACT